VPLTTMDPDTALVVVDLQLGTVGLPLVRPSDEIVRRCTELIGAFRQCDLPVVLINVAGVPPGRTERGLPAGPIADAWTPLIPELDPHLSDFLITKHSRSAFANTHLLELLHAHAVTQVVVVGLTTSVGVESTARDAYEHGFHVTVATDATTDLDAADHDHTVSCVLPQIGETGTTAEIVGHLHRRR
jgi:nicotinamidase-related amidase